jgi:hypothetical protein
MTMAADRVKRSRKQRRLFKSNKIRIPVARGRDFDSLGFG